MLFLLSSTTLAAHVAVSPPFLSRPCLNHLLDHAVIHCMEIFFNDLHQHRPLSLSHARILPPWMSLVYVRQCLDLSNVVASQEQCTIVCDFEMCALCTSTVPAPLCH